MLAFGARYLFDYVMPGGVASDLPADAPRLLLLHSIRVLEDRVSELRSIYDEHAGSRTAFAKLEDWRQELAQKLGAVGLGRTRIGHSVAICEWTIRGRPTTGSNPKLVTQTSGDVAARVQVRFDEIFESLRLCRALLAEDLLAGPFDSPFLLRSRIFLGSGSSKAGAVQ